MKKTLLALSAGLAIAATAWSEPGITFFSDEVPRYRNFAAGIFGTNQYGIGGWSDYAAATLGGGLSLEYTTPLRLPGNTDLGASLHLDYAHIFPKSGSTLRRGDDLDFYAGLWLRLPFTAWGQRLALQPELGWGAALHNADGQNGSPAAGWYDDQAVTFAPALRWIPRRLDTVEIEFSPLYTLAPEKEHALNQLGVRLGAAWHFDSMIQERRARKEAARQAAIAEQQRLERERQEEEAKRLREEEEAKRRAMEEAANEAERQRLAEELRRAEEERRAAEEEAARIAEEERLKAEAEAARIAAEEARRAEIASWGRPELSVTVTGGDRFTPDGDGLDDKVSFAVGIRYVEEEPESWQVVITDPKGNPFRTIKGRGALPEAIDWDGTSDGGETVFSRNTYTAEITVVPSRTDRTRSGAKTATAKVQITTGTLLQTIIPEHEWKIVVNTINFDADKATFDTLTSEQMAEVKATLDDVAAQIQAHPGSSVVVQGYANNVSGSEREQMEELLPLSQLRAETVATELVSRGIDAEIISAEGKGGENPIASRRDKANWWKNRRIEFIIKK